MENETNLRNLLIAFAAIIGVMVIWQTFIWGPQNKETAKAREAEMAQKAKIENVVETSDDDAVNVNDPVKPGVTDVRVPFDGPAMDGSILLRGARVDQLKLKDYYETLEDKEAQNASGEVEIFYPQATGHGYYGLWGWQFAAVGADDLSNTATRQRITTANSYWTLVSGDKLTPETPITLAYSGSNVTISREVSIDENFMFTFTDTVTNTSDKEVAVQPYGVLRQFGHPEEEISKGRKNNAMILHQGVVGATGGELHMQSYKKMEKEKAAFTKSSDKGGWIGLTDKYWLGAIIPQQDKSFSLKYDTHAAGTKQEFRATIESEAVLLAPGASTTSVNRVFGGAKESDVLRGYQDDLNIPRFVDAIDWGKMFFWLTKPFFFVLSFINGYVGNFGVSILILTVIVKGLFFPIQNKAYQSMAKMREMAEPMKKIRETVSDKAEQQKQIAKLYQEHKINPVAGCLPIFFQMPVFYGLYKTLYVTIEMRHEPFFGWIHDLSAPDPTAIGNLFGLLPISIESLQSVPFIGPAVLTIGVLPILYGVTMWALQSLNPPPTDETQKMIFGFLPIIFTFVFAGFAAGLVIYWCWSNFLSILQQYAIMRRNGVKTQLDTFIESKLGKKGKAES